MLHSPRLVVLLLLATTTATACRRNRPAATTPAPVVQTNDADADRARRDAEAREAAARAEEERLRAEREAAERARAAARAALEATVYFGFDRYDLDAAARETLDAKLPVMQSNPALRIRVAGHTDEQGSDEYNLALGQRRAAAAKRYLTQRGISGDRIEIVSMGEEQPTCSESTESCWSRNRRDEFTVTVGTIATAPLPMR
jgi:peptidoglycan-associated lipoprotein